ncbi:MAG TPA: exodeoxyribonuclease VII large subunit, partial [Methylomirabilota bacterium]|nr:exodeoxyribonuclease VII large subunit [Methylomirabilota bacterium]
DKMRLLLHEQRHRLQELVTHAGFRRLEEILRQNRQRADELLMRLGDALETRLELVRRRLTIAQTRIASFDLRQRIQAMRLRIGQRSEELRRRVERLLAAKRQRIERLGVQLEERSPLRVLERGYAIAYDAAGHILRSPDQVALGDEVRVQLARGRLITDVRKREV